MQWCWCGCAVCAVCAVAGGGCRERWTPRRDLVKPSRGLLKPARCAVALVQRAGPTGAEATDIKRAHRGWALGAGTGVG